MIRALDHINIATSDLEGTRDFFVEALGFEVGPRPDVPMPGYWLYAGGRALVHLQLARGPVSSSRASALNHAAFEVADLEAAAARLESRGIAYRRIDMAGSPVRQIFLEDPNGVFVELNAARAAPES